MPPGSGNQRTEIMELDAIVFHHQTNDRIGKHVLEQGLGIRVPLPWRLHDVGAS